MNGILLLVHFFMWPLTMHEIKKNQQWPEIIVKIKFYRHFQWIFTIPIARFFSIEAGHKVNIQFMSAKTCNEFALNALETE